MNAPTVPFSAFFLEKTKNGIHKGPDFIGSGTKFVRMGDLFTFDRLWSSWDGYQLIELSTSQRDRAKLLSDDLLFCRTSVAAQGVGKCSLVTEANEDLVPASNLIRVRLDKERADPPFFYYFFTSALGHSLLLTKTRGAAVYTITGGDIAAIEVPDWPLKTQRIIAQVLTCYDELIENNMRRIRILEEMAQAIYTEWFVEFRFPSHEDVPMVEAERGPIPAGWRWAEVGDLAREVRRGVDPATLDPDTPYIGLEHLPEHSMAIEAWGRAEEAGSRKYLFEPGDVLFGKIRPYFHKVGIPPVTGICSTDAIVIRPRDSDLAGVVLAVVSSDPFVAYAVQTSQGTKMPRANWSLLERYPVALPGGDLGRRFGEYMADTVQLIHSLLLSNRNLRATRDFLLPRLISGDVDVSDLDIDTSGLVA